MRASTQGSLSAAFASIAILFFVAFSVSVPSAQSAELQVSTVQRYSATSSRISISSNLPTQTSRTSGGVDDQLQLEIEFPDGRSNQFKLSPRKSASADFRLVEQQSGAIQEVAPSPVQIFVGTDAAVPGSFVYLALDESGRTYGAIDYPSGDDWYISTMPDNSATYLSSLSGGSNIPEDVPVCGLTPDDIRRVAPSNLTSIMSTTGPRLARVAIDVDSLFRSIFPSTPATAAYVTSLIAYISAIYERDLDVTLSLRQVRVFTGSTPYPISDVGAFADYWENNEDTSLYDIVHLFTASRDLPFGGIAFLSGSCSGAFGIDGFLLGSFPAGPPTFGRGLWDLVVVSHEMGHNLGTLHTHDGYDPPIDSCYVNNSPNKSMIGTIMSYCHTQLGGELNIDLRMHRRVSEVVVDRVLTDGCLGFDCNLNGINDAIDIGNATSADVNGDQIPDECQDCNGNSELDPIDIANGAPDVNNNGIPDVCEPDLDGSGVPDQFEISLGNRFDLDGNFVPDNVDPACTNPAIPNFTALGDSLKFDLDRNRIPDGCASEDCNANGQPEWLDLERQRYIYCAFPGYSTVMEFHSRSAAFTRSFNTGLSNVIGMTVTSDRRVVLLDASGQIKGIDTGGAILNYTTYPTATDICAIGNRFVIADTGSGGELRLALNGSGSSIFTLPLTVAGNPEYPVALTASPAGTLYVVTRERSIVEYAVSSTDITLLGLRVLGTDAGPLVDPTTIAVITPSRILVGSGGTGQIFEYNGLTGQYVREFLVLAQNQSAISDIVIGPERTTQYPDGLVFLARTNIARVNMIDPALNRPIVNFVRGLTSPIPNGISEIAFMIDSDHDCNHNGRLDTCDIILGSSTDSNGDGRPDECGAPPIGCCEGGTGDPNCDTSVDIADLTVVVDHLFITFAPLCCDDEADFDLNSSIDIADLTVLVDHLFISFAPLPSCP